MPIDDAVPSPSPPATGAAPGDHALAAELAAETGALLVGIRRDLVRGGAHPWMVRDEGDWRANELIVTRLAAARPDDRVLSEEGAPPRPRTGAPDERVWIVDPLDGTNEYGEPGREDWAVHVALVVGDRPAAGAVALPAEGLVLATEPPPPSPPALGDRPPRLVVSRTRPPYAALTVAEALGADLVRLGSAGAKTMAVVRGKADLYVHAGGQYEWDSAAPVAVAHAAGLHVSRLDGSPLRYNRPDPWLPDLLVCRPELAPAVLAALGR